MTKDGLSRCGHNGQFHGRVVDRVYRNNACVIITFQDGDYVCYGLDHDDNDYHYIVAEPNPSDESLHGAGLISDDEFRRREVETARKKAAKLRGELDLLEKKIAAAP